MRHRLVLLLTVVIAAAVTAPAAAAAPAPESADVQAGIEAEHPAFAQDTSDHPTLTQDTACEYPLEVTDATGETITLDEAPDSVVALQASDAQTMVEIGADDRLDALPHSDATSSLDRGDRADIGDGWDVDHEQIIATDPDLVLAANTTQAEDIETLRDEADFDVYHFAEAESIDDVRENVRQTGELVDECEGAAETVDWMDEQLEIVDTALDDVDHPLAYYTMGEDGMTAGTDTFVHEILTTAGLENVAERADIESYQQINSETVVDEDPEWIVYPDDREAPPIPDSVQDVTATEQDNVIAADANQLNQPAPHVVSAVVSIVEDVHPEAYEEASAELEESPAGDDDGAVDEDGDRTDDSIPGFGAAAAVGAILVALGLRTRLR